MYKMAYLRVHTLLVDYYRKNNLHLRHFFQLFHLGRYNPNYQRDFERKPNPRYRDFDNSPFEENRNRKNRYLHQCVQYYQWFQPRILQCQESFLAFFFPCRAYHRMSLIKILVLNCLTMLSTPELQTKFISVGYSLRKK